jgi:hypothetical protein
LLTVQPQQPEMQGVPQEVEMASTEKLVFLCLSTLMFNPYPANVENMVSS